MPVLYYHRNLYVTEGPLFQAGGVFRCPSGLSCFLFVFNSCIGLSMLLYEKISIPNISNLEYDLSILLKIKSNGGVALPSHIKFVLLVLNSKYMTAPFELLLVLINAIQSFIIGLQCRSIHTHPFPGAISLKSNHFFPNSK